jgi:pimeloyl-ACP methyl ester carboxylesterase
MRNVLPVPAAAALAVLAAVAVAISGCSGGSPQAASQPSAGTSPAAATSPAGQRPAAGTPRLHWHQCAGLAGQLRCASLRVPVDYRHPGGRKITLALSEVPATAPSGRLGALLVNPGGPGGSGLSLAAGVADGLDPAVAARYDIIGFDPRGVGSSTPALHCDPSFFAGARPDYIPASKAAERVLTGRAKAYAADCERKYGWLLPHLTTQDTARDIDSIRAALGAAQISYFAYSYGTYIGQVYATMFPSRVRRMVLDSTVDPTGVWYADNIAQDYAFQGRQDAFFSWIASHAGIFGLGSTRSQVSRAWYQARARLKAHPVRVSGSAQVGADEFDDTFLVGGYSNGVWPALAGALAAYLHQGSSSALVAAYQAQGRQHENEFAVYNAVECSDVNWPRNWARWDADTRKVYSTAPFEAWDNAWFNAACAFWPVRGPAHPMRIGAKGLPGILMLQGTLDAATPYAGAQRAHKALPSARMVVVEGGGNHGQSLANPPNACVNGYLNRYLATGALPQRPGPVNATCAALPPPPAQ